MSDQVTIDETLQRLDQYRRELAHYLKQQAELGRAYLPFETAEALRRTRENIQQTKALLRQWGVQRADLAEETNDE